MPSYTEQVREKERAYHEQMSRDAQGKTDDYATDSDAQRLVDRYSDRPLRDPRQPVYDRMLNLIQDKEALEHLMAHLPGVYWNSPLAHRLWSKLLP